MKIYKLVFPLLMAVSLSACATTKEEPKVAATADVSAKFSSKGKPYHAIISRHAKANNIPVNLAHAVVFSESSYKAHARGAAGEIGLMQLRLPTARLVGYRGSAKALYDPETNIKYGMKYLGKARQLASGSTCGTILRYNAGHGAKRMNPISQNYCNKVERLLR
ncbi:transglycosylase SLT domain-containing protein [Ahrensia marina]|uniref:Murein transglycosylase n=1 Tax=Ahrensia marina TaxID=1514904 RepID=A0A0M9GN13_9HYPH|nr:transglycosylase SLT domain-containing protein [Ahrensia marina]KPB01737.1 murein transglycosylase [Ahrensia marina]